LNGRISGIEEEEGYKDMLCVEVTLDMPKKDKPKKMTGMECCMPDTQESEIEIPMSASEASEYKVGDRVTLTLTRTAKSDTARGRLGSSLTKSSTGGNK